MADAPQPPGAGANLALFRALAARFGDRFSTSAPLREQHANTLTWIACQPPDAVVFAETTEEVVAVVALCADARVPVIAFGTGTSLEGHVNAPFGGVCIDLSRMNHILAVHEADLDCVVEAGVTGKQLNAHLRDRGLFFPVDPGADATLGGMAATRASGTNAVRYGTMRDNVLALTAVLADGRVIETGTRARKSAAGYDLTRLLIGSEGTLGIITSLTLKLYGLPDTILSAVCPFACIEGACNAYSHLSLPEQPTLFLEFHGTEASAREQVASFAAIAAAEGGGDFQWAERQEDRTKLWQARHDAYWVARGLKPGAELLLTDVCVPISALAACVGETREDIDRLGLLAPIVGHVGDGNFHVMPLFDPKDPEDRRKGAGVSGSADRARAPPRRHEFGGARGGSGQDRLSRRRAWSWN